MTKYNTPSDRQMNQSLQSDDVNSAEQSRWCCWCPKRYFLAVMVFFGSFSMFSLRTNLSIAIIEMTKNRTMIVGGQTVQYEPEFQWDSKTQGVVLSAFSYGFIFSVVGGFVAKRFGGVTTHGSTLLLSGIINTLSPQIVRFNFQLYLVARAMEGFCDNMAYVSMSEIWSRWSPPRERSKLVAFGFTGMYFGTAFTFPMCGLLAHLWGWPVTFYFVGGGSIVVASIILLSFGNEPSTDRCISEGELEYLKREIEDLSNEEVTYSWKRILTNKPLWALFTIKFAYGCGFTFISICIPLYMRDMLGVNIRSIGFLSGVPNMASIFAVPIAGYLADYVQNKGVLTPTQVHKIYVMVGLALGAVCLIAISLISNFTINMILLIWLKILISLVYLTIQLLPIYLAPKNSALISGFTVYGFFFGTLVTPMMIGHVVVSHDAYQWSICLTAVGVVMLVASLLFMFLGSSETQNLFRGKDSTVDRHNNTETLL